MEILKEKELENLLEEQILVEFTGKIQLLDSQHFANRGYIAFKKGKIVGAKLGSKRAERAIVSALLQQERLKLIVETDYITDEKMGTEPIVQKNFSELIEYYENAIIDHQYYQFFSVPDDIDLKINPDFIKRGADLSHDEYAIILALSKGGYANLFEELDLLDHEIIKNLISLRKKRALVTVAKVRRRHENSRTQSR